MKLFSFFETPLVIATSQPTLDLQGEDSAKSSRCPMYREAVKSAVYLCLNGRIEITWHGGHDYEVYVPEWWHEQWTLARRRFVGSAMELGGESDTPLLTYRYSIEAPLGGRNGAMLHAGGLSLNFFTGLSICTDPGVKTLVLPPINNFETAWTVQSGLYDSDIFPGDFSFNFQVLAQGRKIVIPENRPVCSLVPMTPADSSVERTSKEEEVSQWSRSVDWYLKKNSGLKYPSILKEFSGCPHSKEKPPRCSE